MTQPQRSFRLYKTTQTKMKVLRSTGEQPRGINGKVKGHLNRVKETSVPAHRISPQPCRRNHSICCCPFPSLHSLTTHYSYPPSWTTFPPGIFFLFCTQSNVSSARKKRTRVHKFHILPQPVQFAITRFEAGLHLLACLLFLFFVFSKFLNP